MSRSPTAISKSSPAVSARELASATDPRNEPATDASQNERCETVSFAATAAHVIAAELVIAPPDAAENVTATRSVSVAAFDVPDAPGSPVWSFA